VHHQFVIIFELIGKIENIETIAIGGKIHDVARLRKMYGKADGGSSRVLVVYI
jgi:hypothetical protein